MLNHPNRIFISLLFVVLCRSCLVAQGVWIGPVGAEASDYGYFLFRKHFVLSESVREPVYVRVSADNRYRLYINNMPLISGPVPGDCGHYFYDSLDVAPFLQKGENVVAAEVWNYGPWSPVALIGCQPALWIEAVTSAGASLNTNSDWKVLNCKALQPIPVVNMKHVRGGYLGPATDSLQASLYPYGWQLNGFDDSQWQAVVALEEPCMPGCTAGNVRWRLTPRIIPFMEESRRRFGRIAHVEYVSSAKLKYQGDMHFFVPPKCSLSILIDNEELAVGYPELSVSGGAGSHVKLSYAEALYVRGQRDSSGHFEGEAQLKGNRNEWQNKEFVGYYDVYMPDGGPHRAFRTSWFRTFRYVLLEVVTGDEPLTINDFEYTYTAYPFQHRAIFQSSSAFLKHVVEVSWRTLRCCALETYMDCPYYEQLQYIGDTRIQALSSLWLTGDDRLMRQAIEHFYQSIDSEGLTQCRYPSRGSCVIPPFSLFWIGMLHDYWWHTSDTAFTARYADGLRKVIDWHLKYFDNEAGIIGKTPHWSFVDWPAEWAWDPKRNIGGIPQGVENGRSSILNLQFTYALFMAADLMQAWGKSKQAADYQRIGEQINDNVRTLFWDSRRELFADSPEKEQFSQHANVMAVLAGAIEGQDAVRLVERLVADTSLIQCTGYYRFYLFKALEATRRNDLFEPMLDLWKTMLDLNLTTFAEKPEPTRSDCHAWSAHPAYYLLRISAGIQAVAPGMNQFRIAPCLGSLSRLQAAVPVRGEMLRVSYRVRNVDGIDATIWLPDDCNGVFVWGDTSVLLRTGKNKVLLEGEGPGR